MVHSDLTEAPKHDAKNIVLFIKNVCIKNEIYQYNSLYYNLINLFQQTLNNYSVTNAKPFTPSRHIGTNEGEVWVLIIIAYFLFAVYCLP